MIHRCRFDWGRSGPTDIGETRVIYNFFRLLRSTIEEFPSTEVYFVTEGAPQHRLDIDPDYKANRIRVDQTDEEVVYWSSFNAQKEFIISILSTSFPVRVIRHPSYEADDMIYSIVRERSGDNDIVIVSSDTDFIQILNEFPDAVSLWNPLSKGYRETPDYDYVAWKAMVGDRTDNIPGVPRIGKKTATKILGSEGELGRRLGDPLFKKAYDKSYSLIKLEEVDRAGVESSELLSDWDLIRTAFCDLNFKFAFDDNKWNKYKDSFSLLE